MDHAISKNMKKRTTHNKFGTRLIENDIIFGVNYDGHPSTFILFIYDVLHDVLRPYINITKQYTSLRHHGI